MDLRKRRKFSKEFKIDTVNLIKLGEKSVPSLEKELGIQRSTLYSWIRKYDEDHQEAFVWILVIGISSYAKKQLRRINVWKSVFAKKQLRRTGLLFGAWKFIFILFRRTSLLL